MAVMTNPCAVAEARLAAKRKEQAVITRMAELSRLVDLDPVIAARHPHA